MKETGYFAADVVLMNLSEEPDAQGHVLPPECKCDLPEGVPVTYQGTAIGTAYPSRVGNQIVADLEVYSTMRDKAKAIRLMAKLYPAAEIKIIDVYKNMILQFSLEAIDLNPDGNTDPTIPALGLKLCLKPDRNALN